MLFIFVLCVFMDVYHAKRSDIILQPFDDVQENGTAESLGIILKNGFLQKDGMIVSMKVNETVQGSFSMKVNETVQGIMYWPTVRRMYRSGKCFMVVSGQVIDFTTRMVVHVGLSGESYDYMRTKRCGEDVTWSFWNRHPTASKIWHGQSSYSWFPNLKKGSVGRAPNWYINCWKNSDCSSNFCGQIKDWSEGEYAPNTAWGIGGYCCPSGIAGALNKHDISRGTTPQQCGNLPSSWPCYRNENCNSRVCRSGKCVGGITSV